MYYLNEIKEQLLKAITLVEEYEQNGFDIDRQTALDLIRRAYEDLKFCSRITTLVDEPVSPITPSQTEDEPEVEVELIMSDEQEGEQEGVQEETEAETEETEVETEETEAELSESESESEAEQEPVVETTPEPEPEPVVEPEPAKVVVAEPSLFGDDDQWTRPTPSRRRIISLYQDDAHQEPKPRHRRKAAEAAPEPKVAEPIVATPTPTPAPISTPQPAPASEIAEEKVVLADTIETQQTIADTIPSQPSIGQSSAVTTLRGAISVGDRFMLIRELFGGNEAQYERAIDVLEGLDNLDDCIIYIAENFSWKASSEGAKLIMDLLQRKLS